MCMCVDSTEVSRMDRPKSRPPTQHKEKHKTSTKSEDAKKRENALIFSPSEIAWFGKGIGDLFGVRGC